MLHMPLLIYCCFHHHHIVVHSIILTACFIHPQTGMLPSILGDLIANVTITDNGDGDGKHLEEPNLENWGTTGGVT